MQHCEIREISVRRRHLAGWTVANDKMAGKVCHKSEYYKDTRRVKATIMGVFVRGAEGWTIKLTRTE